MTTSIGGELRRYRSLTVALIVGIVASVVAFVGLLSLDMERTRGELRVQAGLHALQTENTLAAVFAAAASQMDFLALAEGLGGGERGESVDRSIEDLRLSKLFEQFCILDAESHQSTYRMRSDRDCPAPYPDMNEVTQEVRIGSGSSASLFISLADAERSSSRLTLFTSAGRGGKAVFVTPLARLIEPGDPAAGSAFGADMTFCLYWFGAVEPFGLGCVGTPDKGLNTDDPAELLRSSGNSFQHSFLVYDQPWLLVTALNGSATATAVSIYPVLALVFLLVATGGICFFIYQSTEKNVQLERRQRSLRHALAELEKRNEDLEQFAYMASHDLQTPVRHVIYRSSMLLDDLEAGDMPAVKQNARRMIDAGDRMQALLLDLLEFCRAGESVLNLSNVDMNELVNRQCAVIRDAAGTLDIKFETGELPTIESDEVKLGQILQNLLENAVKFRNPDEVPTIRIAADWDDAANRWVFSVSDNGIGISQDNLERIFLPFKQLDRERVRAGTGVGLSIARKLVEQLGGVIRAESQPQRGTTFFFTLPPVYTGLKADDYTL